MSISDERRELTAKRFKDVRTSWVDALEKAASGKYWLDVSGDGKLKLPCAVNAIGGFVDFGDFTENSIVVCGYDSIVDTKALDRLTQSEVCINIVNEDTEAITTEPVVGLQNKRIKHRGDRALNEVVRLHTCYVCAGEHIPTLLSEEEAYYLEGILKSLDNGNFRKYKINVVEIEMPEYVEEYVSNVLYHGVKHSRYISGNQGEYETSFRLVGKCVKYAISVEVVW